MELELTAVFQKVSSGYIGFVEELPDVRILKVERLKKQGEI